MKKNLFKVSMFFVVLICILVVFLVIGAFYGKSEVSTLPLQILKIINTKTYPKKYYLKEYHEKGFNGEINTIIFSNFCFSHKFEFLDRHGGESEETMYFIYIYSIPEIENNKARLLWIPFDKDYKDCCLLIENYLDFNY